MGRHVSVCLSPDRLNAIEHRQPRGEPCFNAVLRSLAGSWGRFYSTPSSLDKQITQGGTDEESEGLGGRSRLDVFGWLHADDLSSLACLAARDKWTGMTLILYGGEIKVVERSQPDTEPWFGHMLESLRKSFAGADYDHISNFSLSHIPRGFMSRGEAVMLSVGG